MKTPASPGFVNQILVYSLVAIGATGSVGVGSVWLRHQISIVANANRAIELRITEVARHSEELRTAIAEEQDVTVLQRRNAEWKLGLAAPTQEQVQAVTEDPLVRLAAKRNRDLFTGGVEPVSFRVAWQR